MAVAIRIGEHVAAGTIENTVRGKVTGTLKIKGYDGVLKLDLKGNAHPDMAGCILQFANPNATLIDACYAEGLLAEQIGNAGDISASQKRKVPKNYPEVPDPPFDPDDFVLTNILYLEWFSHHNGRVVIEGVGYEWQIDLPRWRLTDSDIAEQAQLTDDASALFMQLAMEGYEEELDELREEERNEIDPDASDEFTWEQRLKKSEQRTDALMALLDQAKTDDEREKLLRQALESRTESESWRFYVEEVPKIWEQDTHPDLFDADPASVDLAAQIRDKTDELLKGELAETIAHCEDLLMFLVKTRSAAHPFIERDEEFEDLDEPPVIDPGFMIAELKREIARAEKIREDLGDGESTRQRICATTVWEIRDLLVQLVGLLRNLK